MDSYIILPTILYCLLYYIMCSKDFLGWRYKKLDRNYGKNLVTPQKLFHQIVGLFFIIATNLPKIHNNQLNK